jgi:hypothetical protein
VDARVLQLVAHLRRPGARFRQLGWLRRLLGEMGGCDSIWAGWFATLDAMEVGNGGMTTAQQQAVFSLYVLIKTPLYIGADVTMLTGATLEVYKNEHVIAWNQVWCRALARRLARPAQGLGLARIIAFA